MEKGIKPKLCDVYMSKSIYKDDELLRPLVIQEKNAEKIARKFSLTIGEYYGETESACEPYSRPQFYEMAKRIESGKVDGIICWSLDVLSRNPVESRMIYDWIDSGKVKVIYTKSEAFAKNFELLEIVEDV